MTSKLPFPSVVDSSMLAAWKSCRQKFFRGYLQHWKPRSESVHLRAGKAYASGLEAARVAFYEAGTSADQAQAIGLRKLIEEYGDFECPADSAKSLERMCGAMSFYFDKWPLDTDPAKPITLPSGRKGVEFGFLEPLEVLHPVTGDPILYSGRMDSVMEYAGAVYGLDDKTTSQLGASWPKQWDLRSQFSGYCWGARQAGRPLAGFLVRGLSILKTKYDAAEAITYRHPWMIDRWYDATLWQLKEMIAAWEQDWWPHTEDHACNDYGGCEFRQVCLSQDPGPWLEMGFQRKRWDPVLREEILVEEPLL